jgi:hypothetical protein
MRWLVAVVLALAVVATVRLIGCGETTGMGGSGGTGGVGGCNDLSGCCQAPLSDYCEGSECPTWDEAIAKAEECAYFETLLAEYGPCGDLRYVYVRGWFWEFTDYFDASGALVARYGGGDQPFECDGTSSIDIWYGPIPDCTHGTPWESFCEPWGGAASES